MPKKAEVLSNIPLPNITEHKQAEETLRESEEKYHSLFENMLNGFAHCQIIIDENNKPIDFVYLEVNSTFERLTGLRKENVVGRKVTEAIPGIQEAHPELFSIYGKVALTGKPTQFDIYFEPLAIWLSISVYSPQKGYFVAIFENITERKRAEEALQESEEKYRSLFEQMLNGFAYCQILVDENNKPIDFVYLEVNDAYERLTGLKKEDVVGRKVTEAIPGTKEAHPELFRIYGKVALTGKPTQFNYYFEPLKIWLSISVYSPQKGYFVAVFENITERKQAEEALRESEGRYRALINLGGTVGEAIVMLQDKGGVDATHIFVSDEWLNITGYSRKELLGMSFFDLLHPIYRKASLKRHKRKISGEAVPELFEMSIIRKDGTEVPIELTSAYTTYKGERANVAFIRDITERKQTEAKLKSSEERLKILFEFAPDAYYVNDLKGNLIDGNKAAEEITGYKKDELIGKNFLKLNLLPPSQIPKAAALLARNALRQPTGPDELTLNQKDGSQIPTEIRTFPVKIEGQTVVLGIARDITERKRMEQELRKKNEKLDAQNEELRLQGEELKVQQQELIRKSLELEEASQAKSAFLATMSHELRTPLNAVIGFSQLLLDGIPGEVNKEQGQCLSDILSSGEHLLNLINDVLDLSKVEAGKIELKLVSLNLADIIDDMVQAVKPMLEDNRHLLEFSIEEKLPQVRADEDRLRQILLNLMGNAIKFTPPGGKLGIEVSRNGDWCQVSIVDNGIGIKKEDQKQIFKPFTQAGSLPQKRRGGTGLGLALTKQFVEMCGGKIWVESKYRKGSKFTFTLPLATAA